MSKKIAYAIDFGTSNSLLNAIDGNGGISSFSIERQDQTLSDQSTGLGETNILRSVVYFPQKGEPTFGKEAVRQYAESGGDGRLIRSIKKYLPSENFVGTRIGQKMYSLEELVGRFLREMKSRADRHYGSDVKRVVLGRPAKFSMEQKKDQLAQARLKTAAELAGFEEIEFFAEPLAAAYDFRKTLNDEKMVLVVDLGGGTSDFTVIRLSKNKAEVLGLGGVPVAGDALDGSIMSGHISPELGAHVRYQLPMSKNKLTMPPELKERLQSPADITLMSQSDILEFFREITRCKLIESDQEKMDRLFALIEDNLGFAIFEKIEQSKVEICTNEIQCVFEFDYPGVEIEKPMSYSEFQSFTRPNIDSIFSTLSEVMQEAGVVPGDIDLICCTGGTSKVPQVHRRLRDQFGLEKIQSHRNFHSVIQGLSEKALEVF